MARHRIREDLHQRIISGECRPGTKLVQQRLARQFGVSMGLVREALLELQAWGLVEVHDNRGIFVCDWDTDRILESYELREVLEGLAARRCCGRVTPQQLAELHDLVEQIFEVSSEEQWSESTRLEREFHSKIVELSGSRIIARLSENYQFLKKMIWMGSDPGPTRVGHRAMLQAIEENDPERAERLARDHVALGRQTIERRIAAGAFQPHWVD